MRFAFALLLLAALAVSAPALADPFHHGAVASGTPAFGGAMAWLAETQHRLNDAIADAFHNAENGGSRAALALVMALAFLYGVIHAVGPGHGKSVVASYFMAHRARWTGGVLMGSLISLTQGISAVALVGILALVLRAKQVEILNRGTLVEFISYALIVALGVWMFFRAATGRLHAHDDSGRDHDHRGHTRRLDARLILATGLTPCASAIIIMLFALANGAFGLGVAAVAVLTLGMAVTISTIGVATVLGRSALLAVIDRAGMETHRLERGIAMAASVVIVLVSGLMMYDAWTRLLA
jgi:ABC-type nickel/cobalt efflux system permease component RcnA